MIRKMRKQCGGMLLGLNALEGKNGAKQVDVVHHEFLQGDLEQYDALFHMPNGLPPVPFFID